MFSTGFLTNVLHLPNTAKEGHEKAHRNVKRKMKQRLQEKSIEVVRHGRRLDQQTFICTPRKNPIMKHCR